jgi:solute carrier family 25 carnitine/acylcarnitine transporter 20/29
VLCQESQPLLAALLGGAVGGVMRGCVETPAELLKTRLQVGAGLGSASLLLRGLRSTCLPW